MKIKKLRYLRTGALVALGVFLGRGAQAETVLDFNTLPAGQTHNTAIIQTFGDAASTSSDGVTVVGFGTPNIDLTWQASGPGGPVNRWDYYIDAVWSAGQLNSSDVGDRHELVFTPNNPAAAVVVKSFNFHPYYVDTERFTYAVSVLAGATVVAGPITNTFISESTKVPVSINYTGSVGQTLTLRLARVASTLGAGEVEGDPADIAVDDITFAQLPESGFSVGPQVIAVTPADNQVGVAPDGFYQASITNQTTAIVTNTIQLKLNGNPVSPPPAISQAGGLTTVSYRDPTLLLPPGTTNRYRLTYDDNGVPVKSYTNDVQYTVAAYVDIRLPAPIVLESFNSTAEGSVPAGWTAVNLDGLRDPTSEPNINMTNLDSAAYTNFTVVEVSRFTGTFDTYSQLYKGLTQPAGEAEDYQRVLSVNPSNVVNGVYLRNLATGRMAFGNSGYRLDALGQVLFLFSPDFDLTGRHNVYLSFHSLWEQNQDSLAAVEYSIDMGATWLPAMYMLDRPDVFTNLDGSIDSLTTLTNVVIGGFEGIAQWNDGGVTYGGYYGAFIGVASNRWDTLAPYISARVDNDSVGSKRVELIRLAQADNQSKVRLRFVHAGTDSWYWGIDDVGLYELPGLRITSIARSGANVVISWTAEPNTRLQKSPSLTTPNWQDVPGSLGASSISEPAIGSAAYYRLARPL